MNSRKISLALALLASVMYANQVAANSFDYSSLGGAAINFNGSSKFSFSPTSSPNFKITDGALMGFEGDVSGTFTIGAVTTVGIFSTAPVTGTGSLVIDNGATDLTATLSWVSLTQIGTGSTLNDLGTVNLTNINIFGLQPNPGGIGCRGHPCLGYGQRYLEFYFCARKKPCLSEKPCSFHVVFRLDRLHGSGAGRRDNGPLDRNGPRRNRNRGCRSESQGPGHDLSLLFPTLPIKAAHQSMGGLAAF